MKEHMPKKLDAIDWAAAAQELGTQGNLVIPSLLSLTECEALAELYGNDRCFRRRTLLEQEGLGSGEQKYLTNPLPDIVETLRETLYARLAPIANHWNELSGGSATYPKTLQMFAKQYETPDHQCPLSLMSRYVQDNYEGLHQNINDGCIFPLQASILLSSPPDEFSGGEFVMTEQRPRMQSRPLALHLQKGDAVIYAANYRPVKGASGFYRVNLRHGVSRVRSGIRIALDMVFHNGV
jgi:hypothetical protein